jgi:hypothetical protein
MTKKKIIEILNTVNEEKVKDRHSYNKLASTLNLSTQEELGAKDEVIHHGSGRKLFIRLALGVIVFTLGFFICFSITFKSNKSSDSNNQNSNNEDPIIPIRTIVEDIFIAARCQYLKNPIYGFTLENILGFTYIGVNHNNNIIFVFEFNYNISDLNIIVETQDSVNSYYSTALTTNDHYLLVEAQQEVIYNFIVSFSFESTLEFSLNIGGFLPLI